MVHVHCFMSKMMKEVAWLRSLSSTWFETEMRNRQAKVSSAKPFLDAKRFPIRDS
jgi:hypothetical protein